VRNPPTLVLRILPWTLLWLALAAPDRARRAHGDDANHTPLNRWDAAPESLADLRAVEDQVRQTAARVMPSVVALRIGSTLGSGVVVSRDGFVLTAGHVASEPDRDVVFTFSDGNTAEGKTLGIHRGVDAGLAKITDEGPWPVAEMGRSEPLELGAWCMALGHPLGYRQNRPPVVRVGRVLQILPNLIQTDAPLVAGDSGGPLLDLEGRVIGIHSRISRSVRVNIHVPVDVFGEHWDRLARGDAWDEGVAGKDSPEVRAAFREAVAEASDCTVRVQCDGEEAALGTIVGRDGWIVTKASELGGRITCRDRLGRAWEARVVGIHRPYDLAMLKIEAANLPHVRWSETAEPAVGQWVAVAGFDDATALAVGVVGAPRRAIPPAGGVLGIAVADAEGGVRIVKIVPDSAAQKAGLQVDDVITHLNGKPAEEQHGLIGAIKEHEPGEAIRLKVRRGERELEIPATLGGIADAGAKQQRLERQSGYGISRRRDGFPEVLQHDAVLRPADCGGPLVDLSGGVIGVNVARAGRTETYAVPADVLRGLMHDLISGQLAPGEDNGAPDNHSDAPSQATRLGEGT